jgi:hypothetical protein
MTYELRERDFAGFWDVPTRVHPPGYLGVAPMKTDLKKMLDGSANPVLDCEDRITHFTVRRGGAPIGRITAHVHDESNRLHGERRGYFGFFDCADDLGAARLLTDAASDWLRARGCDEAIGSMNLTAMQQIGVVTDGFESAPYIDQTYNAPHVPQLLEACGLERAFPMTTFELDLRSLDPIQLSRLASGPIAGRDDLRCEPVRRSNLLDAMETCRTLLNDTFAKNPMFVPLKREDFAAQAAELTWIMDERLSSTWSVGGQPTGVIVCIPDLNPFLRATRSQLRASTPFHFLRHRFSRRRALVVFGGVTREMQGQGLAGLMLHRTLIELMRAGYTSVGFTWIADENAASLKQMEKLGARPLHRLHLYRRGL